MVKKSITPSDWITYLQGEISSDLAIMLSVVAALFLIVLSIMQVSFITGDTSLFRGDGEMPSMIELTFEFGIILVFILSYIVVLIKPKRRLCKKIIKGKLTKHKDILKEYENNIEPNFNFLKVLKKNPE